METSHPARLRPDEGAVGHTFRTVANARFPDLRLALMIPLPSIGTAATDGRQKGLAVRPRGSDPGGGQGPATGLRLPVWWFAEMAIPRSRPYRPGRGSRSRCLPAGNRNWRGAASWGTSVSGSSASRHPRGSRATGRCRPEVRRSEAGYRPSRGRIQEMIGAKEAIRAKERLRLGEWSQAAPGSQPSATNSLSRPL